MSDVMTEQDIRDLVVQTTQSWLANNFQKTKVSELSEANSLTGLFVLGFLNSASVKAPIELLKGNEGKSVELRNNAGEMQWRVQGGEWAVLFAKDELKGDPFKYEDFTPEQLDRILQAIDNGIEFESNDTHIQYRLKGGNWIDVVSLELIRGPRGHAFKFSDFTSEQIESLKVKGDPGPANVLKLGTVEKGKDASVIISGESPLQEISFVLPQGDQGESIEMQKTATHIQWRVANSEQWINLVALADLEGKQGESIELQKTATHIQWRVVGGAEWLNLVELSELQGEKGNPGVYVGTEEPTDDSNVWIDPSEEYEGYNWKKDW